MSVRSMAHGLYSGTVSYDFVGRRRTWYIVSGAILAVTLGALLFLQLNLGIEFRGGAEFSVPQATCSVESAQDAAESATGGQAIVTQVGDDTIRVQTQELSPGDSQRVAGELAEVCGVEQSTISAQVVGPTWGADVSRKALQGLVVFLILVTIFLAIYFEWRMAVAALVALAHDLIITIGVYALFGFEVTPATAIGVLTILGYSLYDTVVVFDKVKENTDGILAQGRQTYAEAANLAVNQTLIRSINTSIVALLPVSAILIVGAGLLGAGTLKDLALALFVGMAAGTYSSIFVATPLLVQLKERDPEVQALERRVMSRRRKAAATEAMPADPDDAGADDESVGAAPIGGAARQYSRTVTEGGVRQQPKRTPRSKR